MTIYSETTPWQKAIDLADAVYEAVEVFPKSELFVLSHQMRSAATSIPSNIAEGNGRRTFADYRQFVAQAWGSAYELETQIVIATRRRFLDEAAAQSLLERTRQVCQLINGLLCYLDRRCSSDNG